MPLLFTVLAATTTTVEPEVPRIVGDPLSWWTFIGAGVALLAVILVAGLLLKRRASTAVDHR